MTERVDPSTWPLYPPESWFDLPPEVPDDVYCNVVLDGPEAGRVYGLVHHAGTNLLGAPGGPWTPPPSPSSLHDSQLGQTETAEGTIVRTANVGGRVNHAPLTAGYYEAVKHYENIASQTMRVRYHQIQTPSGPAIAYSGAMWPDVTEIDVARVRASALSGDWRWRAEYNGYDFCGSQLVTNPGLPLRMVAAVGDEHPPIVVCEDGTCSMPVDPVEARLNDVEEAVLEFADLLGYTVEPAPQTAAICAPIDRLDDIDAALEELLLGAAMAAAATDVDYIKGEDGKFQGSRAKDGSTPTPKSNAERAAERGREVARIVAENKDKATDVVHKTDGVWNPDRVEEQRQLLDSYWERNNLADVPADREAIIMGGLPGAGKSTALDSDELGIQTSDYVTVNPDDMKEELNKAGMGADVPELKANEKAFLNHEESSDLAGDLMARSISEGKNIILDGTLGSQRSAETKIQTLKDAGYSVRMVFVDVPIEQSKESAAARFARATYDSDGTPTADGGRYIPPEIIDQQADATYGSVNRANYEALKDSVDGYQLWDNTDFKGVLVESK